MIKKQMFYLMLLAALFTTGCNHYNSKQPADEDLVEVSYDAVNNLLTNLKQAMPKGQMVVINSLVNDDNLKQTSSFGRIISDQLASAFHRAGYRVMGMELPTQLFVKNEAGILQLSKKAKSALNDVGAKALVIGSFAPGRYHTYISLRIVDIANQNIISTTDYSVPIGPDVKNLLKPKKTKEKKSASESENTSGEEVEFQ